MMGWPGRTHPTVELEVPKSMPQACAILIIRNQKGRYFNRARRGLGATPRARKGL